jgi:hypothetical protein
MPQQFVGNYTGTAVVFTEKFYYGSSTSSKQVFPVHLKVTPRITGRNFVEGYTYINDGMYTSISYKDFRNEFVNNFFNTLSHYQSIFVNPYTGKTETGSGTARISLKPIGKRIKYTITYKLTEGSYAYIFAKLTLYKRYK